MDYAAENSLYLADFGEAVSLETLGYSETVPAVVDLVDENAEPLMPGASRHWFQLTMAADKAAQLTADWSVVVRGVRRPVIATPVPNGAGLAVVWLGDAEEV